MRQIGLVLLRRKKRHYWGKCWCGRVHIMPLLLRLFYTFSGLFVATAMGVAFLAVFNTWLYYSLPLAQAIVLEVITGTIAIAGAVIAAAAIRYHDPRKVKKPKAARWPYNSFSSMP